MFDYIYLQAINDVEPTIMKLIHDQGPLSVCKIFRKKKKKKLNLKRGNIDKIRELLLTSKRLNARASILPQPTNQDINVTDFLRASLSTSTFHRSFIYIVRREQQQNPFLTTVEQITIQMRLNLFKLIIYFCKIYN